MAEIYSKMSGVTRGLWRNRLNKEQPNAGAHLDGAYWELCFCSLLE